jgi:hypothetical protein
MCGTVFVYFNLRYRSERPPADIIFKVPRPSRYNAIIQNIRQTPNTSQRRQAKRRYEHGIERHARGPPSTPRTNQLAPTYRTVLDDLPSRATIAKWPLVKIFQLWCWKPSNSWCRWRRRKANCYIHLAKVHRDGYRPLHDDKMTSRFRGWSLCHVTSLPRL